MTAKGEGRMTARKWLCGGGGGFEGGEDGIRAVSMSGESVIELMDEYAQAYADAQSARPASDASGPSIGLGIVGSQLRQIPQQNAQGWNRYDTDTEHKLHVWADGKSYDIRVPKEEYLHAAGSAAPATPEAGKINDHAYQTDGASRDPSCAVCGGEWSEHERKR